MRACYVSAFDRDNPLAALEVGDLAEVSVPDEWVRVAVRAASLNRHDLWSLAGFGLKADQLPMVLGCDAAGVTDDGTEVVVHAVISDPDWSGDETLAPTRSLLSEKHPGTLAEYVWVPRRNLLPKPGSMSWAAAACLPTAWLTAYRMIFTQSGAKPGDSVLVQGGSGGVSTALVVLGVAAGLRVHVTSRSEQTRQRCTELGAQAHEPGARLPEKVAAVFESVGAATWSHSVKCLRPGGTLVICGATTGDAPKSAELTRIFFQQMRVQGSTMGTRDELTQLIAFCETAQIAPVIDREVDFGDDDAVRSGFAALADGDVFGKVVCVA